MDPDWWVYSTTTDDGSLLVEDRNSGNRGYVSDPTKLEWAAAYHAPSKPYPWTDASRVVIDNNVPAPFSEEVKDAALEMARNRCQGPLVQ
jgi:hypothetical protein